MKILYAVNRDPDVFITLSDTDVPVIPGVSAPFTVTVNLVEGVNTITHAAGWKPRIITASILDDTGVMEENNPVVWYTKPLDNPTTKIFVTSDKVIASQVLTLYR